MPIMETRVRLFGKGEPWSWIEPTLDRAGDEYAAKVIARLNGQWAEIATNRAIEVAWKWRGEPIDALRIETGPFSRECGVTAEYP